MVKHTLRNGFTLLECCIAIFIMSLLLLISLYSYELKETTFYTFMDEYLYNQSLAMKDKKIIIIPREEAADIHFNENGNVSMAKTIYFNNNRRIVIELGGGRLEYK